MTKLPNISGRECIRALQQIGFEVIGQQGSHVKMRRDDPYAQLIVPLHREIKPGTLRSIIRQAGLNIDTFIALL